MEDSQTHELVLATTSWTSAERGRTFGGVELVLLETCTYVHEALRDEYIDCESDEVRSMRTAMLDFSLLLQRAFVTMLGRPVAKAHIECLEFSRLKLLRALRALRSRLIYFVGFMLRQGGNITTFNCVSILLLYMKCYFK